MGLACSELAVDACLELVAVAVAVVATADPLELDTELVANHFTSSDTRWHP